MFELYINVTNFCGWHDAKNVVGGILWENIGEDSRGIRNRFQDIETIRAIEIILYYITLLWKSTRFFMKIFCLFYRLRMLNISRVPLFWKEKRISLLNVNKKHTNIRSLLFLVILYDIILYKLLFNNFPWVSDYQ